MCWSAKMPAAAAPPTPPTQRDATFAGLVKRAGAAGESQDKQTMITGPLGAGQADGTKTKLGAA